MSDTPPSVQTDPCDKCGSEIVSNVFAPHRAMQFSDPDTAHDEFAVVSFLLCDECEAHIVDWIRGDEDTDRSVNTVGMESFADDMEQTADELAAIASLFRNRIRGDTDD